MKKFCGFDEITLRIVGHGKVWVDQQGVDETTKHPENRKFFFVCFVSFVVKYQ